MATGTQQAADRVYEDFEPYYEWSRDQGRFNVMLPGYRRDQLKVQVTSKPALRLMGERPIIGNRWRRFSVEFPIPSDYDTDNVTAAFEGGKLSVSFAKLTKPKETTNPPKETSKPEESSQKDAKEDTPKAKEDKAEAKTDEASDQKTPQKEKEPIDETETEANMDKVTEEVRTNKGLNETTEAAISKAPKPKDTKSVSRSKTRLIDFTLRFEPSNQVDNKAIGDSTAGINKWKELVKWVMLILLVVGLGLCARNAFRSFHSQGEWNLEEMFFPY